MHLNVVSSLELWDILFHLLPQNSLAVHPSLWNHSILPKRFQPVDWVLDRDHTSIYSNDIWWDTEWQVLKKVLLLNRIAASSADHSLELADRRQLTSMLCGNNIMLSQEALWQCQKKNKARNKYVDHRFSLKHSWKSFQSLKAYYKFCATFSSEIS